MDCMHGIGAICQMQALLQTFEEEDRTGQRSTGASLSAFDSAKSNRSDDRDKRNGSVNHHDNEDRCRWIQRLTTCVAQLCKLGETSELDELRRRYAEYSLFHELAHRRPPGVTQNQRHYKREIVQRCGWPEKKIDKEIAKGKKMSNWCGGHVGLLAATPIVKKAFETKIKIGDFWQATMAEARTAGDRHNREEQRESTRVICELGQCVLQRIMYGKPLPPAVETLLQHPDAEDENIHGTLGTRMDMYLEWMKANQKEGCNCFHE